MATGLYVSKNEADCVRHVRLILRKWERRQFTCLTQHQYTYWKHWQQALIPISDPGWVHSTLHRMMNRKNTEKSLHSCTLSERSVNRSELSIAPLCVFTRQEHKALLPMEISIYIYCGVTAVGAQILTCNYSWPYLHLITMKISEVQRFSFSNCYGWKEEEV